jgi:hypothetical protein
MLYYYAKALKLDLIASKVIIKYIIVNGSRYKVLASI